MSRLRTIVAIDRKNPFANPCAHFSTPPSSLAIASKNSVRLVTTDSIAGASAAVNCSLTPLPKDKSLVIASLASSTPLAALVDIAKPNALASPSIAFRPSLPWDRVFTSAAPSESNSLNAKRSRSDSDFTPSNASAKTIMRSSKGILFSSLAFKPSSLIAPLASPVPFAASAVRRVNLCRAISIVCVDTPVRSAA